MKRPSFQFYPDDWTGNGNLKRCSHKLKGVWVDVLCLFHDSEAEYGMLRWPLKEIAQAVGCTVRDLQELRDKSVLKGADPGAQVEPFIYTPRSGRREGEPVTLIAAQPGPLWYSSRMVRDEYVRQVRGEGTRFGDEGGPDPARKPSPKTAPKAAPKPSPNPPFGDGPPSPSPSPAPLDLSPPSVAPAAPAAPAPPAKPKRVRKPKAPEDEGPTVPVWRAYALTFLEVHGVEPVRNAKVNGQLSQLIDRLGKDDAVQVAAFYVRDPLYRAKTHPVDLLLRDAEALRARWAKAERGLPDPATLPRGPLDARTQHRYDRMAEALGHDNPALAGNVTSLTGARQRYDLEAEHVERHSPPRIPRS